MVFSREDKAIIVNYRINHGYGAKRIVAAIKNKKWSTRSVNNVLRMYSITGGIDRKIGSGRPRAISTPETIAAVGELALSQENEPGTHHTQRQISKELDIYRSSVQRIIRKASSSFIFACDV
jgi:transposase